MPPFFTIITSTYNAAATLPRLLDSLASQTCRDFNWIVQDGASSDATMQIVEQYRDRLPEILADSSKDSGIYDAWNKAVDRWQGRIGEWVLFLGADDALYEQHTLEYCKDKLQYKPADTIFGVGDILIVDYNSKTEKFIAVDTERAFSQRYRETPLPHSSLFQKSSLFLTYRFKTKYKIAGDYDFMLENWCTPSQASALHICVTRMAAGGISSDLIFNSKLKKELGSIIRNKSIPAYIIYTTLESSLVKKIKYLLRNMPFGDKILHILKKLLYN